MGSTRDSILFQSPENDSAGNEILKNIVLRDGDWGLYYGSTGATCIRHLGCNQLSAQEGYKDGSCSCGGKCSNCKAEVPQRMMGFRSMVQWEK